MNRVIQTHQPAVAELCRQFGVERQFEIIGEALGKAAGMDPTLAEQMPEPALGRHV